MESLSLNVRVNSKDKKEFENFCNSVGMNVSTAINMFIKTVIRDQRLPFDVKTYSIDNKLYQFIKEAEDEMYNTDKRYSKEDVINIINEMLNKSIKK